MNGQKVYLYADESPCNLYLIISFPVSKVYPSPTAFFREYACFRCFELLPTFAKRYTFL